MAIKIVGTLISIAATGLVSMTLFSPGDVPRQIALVTMWYLAGAATVAMWQS